MTEQASQILDHNTKIGQNTCTFDLEYQFGVGNSESLPSTKRTID